MRNVLVVEDDAAAARVIELVLGLDGHDVRVAQSISSAHAALAAATADLIVLDLTLPDGNGLELLRALREGLAPRTPVIVLSGIACERTVARAFRLGADDYLTKPFSPVELAARAERLLRATSLVA